MIAMMSCLMPAAFLLPRFHSMLIRRLFIDCRATLIRFIDYFRFSSFFSVIAAR